MKRSKSTGRFDDLLRILTATDRAKRRRPPKRKGGGSEAVTVEPNRPKLNEGGAAAALEFDK